MTDEDQRRSVGRMINSNNGAEHRRRDGSAVRQLRPYFADFAQCFAVDHCAGSNMAGSTGMSTFHAE